MTKAFSTTVNGSRFRRPHCNNINFFVKNIRGYQQGKVDSDYDIYFISIIIISGVNVVFRMAVRFSVGPKTTVAPQPT